LTPDETCPKLFLATLKKAVEYIVSEELADLRTHKNLFNFRFAESREFFSHILERRSSPVHGFYEVFHQTEFDV